MHTWQGLRVSVALRHEDFSGFHECHAPPGTGTGTPRLQAAGCRVRGRAGCGTATSVIPEICAHTLLLGHTPQQQQLLAQVEYNTLQQHSNARRCTAQCCQWQCHMVLQCYQCRLQCSSLRTSLARLGHQVVGWPTCSCSSVQLVCLLGPL